MFEALAGFKERHGHCNVPRVYPENQALAVWLETQRTNERYDKINPDRKAKLSAIGVTWRNRNGKRDGWDTRISELKRFKERKPKRTQAISPKPSCVRRQGGIMLVA